MKRDISITPRTLIILVALVFPVLVFAQEVATSSVATSTEQLSPPLIEDTAASSTVPADMIQASSTTEEVIDTTPATSTATTTPETIPDAVPPDSEISPSAAVSDISAPIATSSVSLTEIRTFIDAIAALEDEYIFRHKKYLQILPGNQLPPYEMDGTVSSKLGADAPSDIRVDIYQSPLGWGYQITYDDGSTHYSVGYGPEAKNRTHIEQRTALAATSSPAI